MKLQAILHLSGRRAAAISVYSVDGWREVRDRDWAGQSGRVFKEPTMKHLLCLEHHTAIQADARARMNVHVVSGFTGNWFTTTKPYAHQRPSGAPPG